MQDKPKEAPGPLTATQRTAWKKRSAKQRWSFISLVLLFFAMATYGFYQIGQNQHNARLGKEAHDAICVLKNDRIRDVNSAMVFIKKNPGGFGDITADEILKSAQDKISTVDALSAVHCKHQMFMYRSPDEVRG